MGRTEKDNDYRNGDNQNIENVEKRKKKREEDGKGRRRRRRGGE